MGARKSDRELRQRVLAEFERDERLEKVHVAVQNGRVTLSGTVDSYGKRLAARAAVHRGAGLCELTDNMQVRLPGAGARTDRELAAAVAQALQWDAFVPDRKIRLAVARGRVTLEGEVDTIWEKEDAARVVRHVAGVRGIQNRIRVKDLPRDPAAPSRPLQKQP